MSLYRIDTKAPRLLLYLKHDPDTLAATVECGQNVVIEIEGQQVVSGAMMTVDKYSLRLVNEQHEQITVPLELIGEPHPGGALVYPEEDEVGNPNLAFRKKKATECQRKFKEFFEDEEELDVDQMFDELFTPTIEPEGE